MTSEGDFIQSSDQWLRQEGPLQHSVVSSRARYARNLEHVPFAPRAHGEQLRAVVERVDEAMGASQLLSGFRRLAVGEVNSLHRLFLKESYLLSPELEQGGEHRVLYISPDYRISIMVNEEDHLRMQCLDTGSQLPKVLAILNEVEAELARLLTFAHSDRFGYLTACPTNVGTGLRLSVMVHLPGLVIINRVDEVLRTVLGEGLTVRGIHGENSEHLGDFYQVSNEVTLGCRREELLERLTRTAELLVQHEMKARDALFEQKPDVARDLLGRALGVLQNAWILNSGEALAHLSKMRLGIDRGYFRPMGHSDLSRLMLDVQPAHLQCRGGGAMPEEKRDSVRAEVIRQRLKNVSWN